MLLPALPFFRPSGRAHFSLALLLFGLGICSPALAQREVRHLNAITAAAGTTGAGYYYQGTYSRYISDKVRFDVSTLLEYGPRDSSPQVANLAAYRAYELGLGIAPRLAHFGEIVYLRLPIQVRGRYERRPPVGGEPDSDGFTAGPAIGLAADVYAIDHLSFYGELRQGWYPIGTVAEKFPRYFGAGLAYHFGM